MTEKPVSLFDLGRFVAIHDFRPPSFRRFGRLPRSAFGFWRSPASAFPSCSSHQESSLMILSVRYFASRFRSGCEKPFRPTCCFNSDEAAKVSREGQRRWCCGRGTACFAQRVVELIRSSRCTAKEPPGLRRMVAFLLGGRNRIRYCASNARSAATTVGPIPTMPSSTLGPSTAIQRSPRENSWGRRTADGLPGWVAQ